MLTYAIAASVFSLVALAAFYFLQPRENVLERRIAGYAFERSGASGPAREGRLLGRIFRPVGLRISRFFTGLLPQNVVQRIDRMIRIADWPISLPRFFAIWGASASLGVGMFMYLVLTAHPSGLRMVMLALALLPFPLMGPYLVLSLRGRRRQRSIVRALPDALDLLVTAVEAGLGVDSAIALVAGRTKGPLADSFRLYLNQVSLGRTRSAALRYMADSTGVKELNNLVVNVMRGEELGITIGDVLRRHATDLREERRNRAREAAYRAPVLMTIPLVLCFLPAMGAVIIVPLVLNLLDFLGTIGG
jgi:tight adherence protein C